MPEVKNIYIIAGETSGDLHGGKLVNALRRMSPALKIRAWGGIKMSDAGVIIAKHISELAFMGFVEVLKNIFTILKNFSFAKKDILDFNPDVVVLIDYPGFNLRMAKWLKKKGFKVVYYISPQLWAWKKKRVEIIRKYVDEMIVILPFEAEFYAKNGISAHYVGHPLLESINSSQNNAAQKKHIALIPGSRAQEVKKILPIMLDAASTLKEYSICIARVDHLPKDIYQNIVGEYQVEYRPINECLQMSEIAYVGSGTATLETALYNVPQIVCYKGNPISYAIAKRIVHVKYISLVNLILDKKAVPELIQNDLTKIKLLSETEKLLHQGIPKQIQSYRRLRNMLGNGKASDMAAQIILKQSQS